MNDVFNAQSSLICMNYGFENRSGVKNCAVCGDVLLDYNVIELNPSEDVDVEDEDLTEYSQRRPWSRYFARQIDYTIFGLFIGPFLPIFPSIHPIVRNILYSSLLMFIWIPIEALFLSKFTATPGKWMFNISVKTSLDEMLTYKQALKRGLKIFYRGLFLGIPVLSLISLWDSHDRLLEKGKTIWDSEGNLRVQHKKIGIKIIVIIFIFVLFILARRGV